MAKRADVLQEIDDLGFQALPEVFRQLVDCALGLCVVVEMGEEPPRGSKLLGIGRVDGGGGVRVYRERPDTGLLRYLHEHLAGKAKVREEKGVDPVINVNFGPLDLEYSAPDEVELAAAMNGAREEPWGEEDRSKAGDNLREKWENGINPITGEPR